MGNEKATKFFQERETECSGPCSNKQVAQAVSSGQLAFGLTDTDDALIEIDSGLPSRSSSLTKPISNRHFDDPQHRGGTEGCPHPVAARALQITYCPEDTEGRLAMGSSGQFPLRPNHPKSLEPS